MNDLASLLIERKRTPEAVELARKAVEVFRAAMGPEHLNAMTAETVLGEALYKDGKLEEAEALLRGTLARQVAAAGPESDRALEAGRFLAETLAAAGKRDEAEALYRKALDAPPERLGPRRRARVLRSYGERLTDWERFDEAREALEASYRFAVETASPRSRPACKTAAALVTLLDRRPGHDRDAATWRRRSRGGAVDRATVCRTGSTASARFPYRGEQTRLSYPDLHFGGLCSTGRLEVEGDLVEFLEATYRAA
jgi:tetratricopeptide (TPR) repeat protein